MAVTLLASGSAAGNGTTASFTPPDNSLLVVFYGVVDNAAGNVSAGLTASGGGWTYTSRHNLGVAGSFHAQDRVWTAPVTTGASMTITFGAGGALTSSGWYVWAVTNYLTASPVGGIGASNNGGGTPPSTLHAEIPAWGPTINDVLFTYAYFDGNNTGTYSKTANASMTAEAVITNNTPGMAGSGMYRLASSQTGNQWDDIDTGTMTLFSYVAVSMVIRGNPPTVTPSTSGAIQVVML